MNNQNNANRLITREEAAEILGLKPQTLAKWACLKRGDLKMVKLGRSVRYRLKDLEEFIEENYAMNE